MITAASRKSRAIAEYDAMCSIPINPLFAWKPAPGQKPPYVTSYIVTYNNKTLVKASSGSIVPQLKTTVQIDINPDTFPIGAPTARVVAGTVPYHPNWWENGYVCNGNIWHTDMWLWQYIIKIGRVLAFDPAVTNTGSPANPASVSYWNAHIRDFPCGRINYAHPKGF